MELFIALLLLFLLIIFGSIYTLSVFNNIFYGIPQVPTFDSDLIVLKKELKRYDLEGKKIVDLGSGIGKMLRFFEKEFKMKSIGYEIDFGNYLICKIINKLYSSSSQVYRSNFLKANLKETDYIYVYLFPKIINKLELKIWQEAKPGTIIFSNAFKFKDHKPKEIFYSENGKEEVYVYEV